MPTNIKRNGFISWVGRIGQLAGLTMLGLVVCALIEGGEISTTGAFITVAVCVALFFYLTRQYIWGTEDDEWDGDML